MISAPSGTGKSTLVDMLLEEFPHEVAESRSCTTRPPRENERTNHHYDFISHASFQEKIAASEFLEYAEVFGHYYGTRRQEVARLQNEGKHVILVIDTQGALQLKERCEAVFIFIAPPSKEELATRLKQRSTESESEIEARLAWAEKEMALASHYDYSIVNDNLEITYQLLRCILVAEEHKTR